MHTTTAGLEEWMTREDAARLASCSVATIRRWHQQHRLPTREGANGKVLVRVGDLIDYGKITAEMVQAHGGGTSAATTARLDEEMTQLRERVAFLQGRLEGAQAELLKSNASQLTEAQRAQRESQGLLRQLTSLLLRGSGSAA